MQVNLKQLLSQSMLYGLGNLLPKAIGFFLIPIYTRYLTPSDYGVLSVATTVSSVLSICLQCGLQGAITRFHYDFLDDRRAQQAYYGTIWLFLTGMVLCCGLLLLWFGEAAFNRLFTQVPFRPFGQLAIGISCFGTAATIPLVLFRVREQAARYISFSIAQFLLLTLGIIYFVTILQQGALGSLSAQLWVGLLFAVPYTFISLRNLRLTFDTDKLKRSLKFGLPLVPHQLSGWALTASDRILLERAVPLNQLGLYSLGYRFGSILDIMVTSLNMAWSPFFFRVAASNKNAPQVFARVTTYYMLGILSVALAIALVSKEIITLIAKPNFHDAHQVVPIIVLASFLHGIYFIAVNPLFFLKRTQNLPIYTLIAAVTNIGLNILTLSRYGIIAAAWSTVVGFAISAMLVFRESHRVYPIPYEYGRLAQLLITCLVFFAVGYFVNTGNIYLDMLYKLLCVLIYPISLWWQRFFSESELDQLRVIIKKVTVGVVKKR